MVNSERERKHGLGGAIVRRLVAFLPSRRGNVAVLTGLLMVPFVASLSLGGELGMWFMTNRSMQNAADSAAIAAATTRSTTTTIFQPEAYAVATQYGFTNGANNVTVSASYGITTGAGCSVAEPCYKVQIQKTVPLYFASIVGFPGNATLNGQKAETITATAVATSSGGGTAATFCILALSGTVGNDITLNGNPMSSMPGCSIASDDTLRCNGHEIANTVSEYTVNPIQNNKDCAPAPDHILATPYPDPYAGLAADIPSSNCASYAGVSIAGNQPAPSAPICGPVTLTADATYPSGTTLTIVGGTLNTNGHTLTMDGSTVIFTNGGKTPPGSPIYTPTGGGTINLTAPTDSANPFADIAIYQDPRMADTNGQLDITAAGNAPTWNITGIVYTPNANVTVSGAVNKNATNVCIGFVVNSMTINGTGDLIDDTSQCAAAGITLPGLPGDSIALVQ